jgi:3-oxoacyl-ACP reductase-like protein
VSRAMNLALPEADVRSQCRSARIEISATEPLPDGGTRLVLTTSEGADEARHRFRKHLIEGHVRRMASLWVRNR